MKFFHLSDLHIGKRLCEFSLIEDQSYILDKIVEAVISERPDAVVIAGDVFDKPIPPADAVTLFDEFLYSLSKLDTTVLVISGNHDSAERLSFGGRLMEKSNIHISPVYTGTVEPVSQRDESGEVNFYLLPFIKPSNVRRYYPDENIDTYTDAVRTAIEHMNIDTSKRNVLVTHQFITGASRSDSEEISVGGSDNVDASVLSVFDYTALGHIHAPQKIGSDSIRYSGTPLKYSFSEVSHKKSISVVELGKKGDVRISFIPLEPIRDMRELRGTYEELTLRDNYIKTNTDDYIHITLTDENDIPEAMSRLRVIYPNLMKLDYDNTRTRANSVFTEPEAVRVRSPLEMFSELYEKQNGASMDELQFKHMEELILKIWDKEEV